MRQVIFTIMLIMLVPLVAVLEAQNTWNLPRDFNDTNTSIKFEVDSTWHLVKGATKGIHGSAWLQDPSDYASIRAELILPIGSFDTGSSSRDERMREVMHADLYPEVRLVISNTIGVCDPSALNVGASCSATLEGILNINNTRRQLRIPAQVRHDVEGYAVSGKIAFNWADFGIEDPSIFIAKLDPTVSVDFTVNLLDTETPMEENNAKPS